MRENDERRPLGRVVGLWRYPVKSMAGERLTGIEVSWHGFAGDRRWAFLRNDGRPNGFPWLTLRERSDMSQFCASLADPLLPDKSSTIVTTPAGTAFDVTDAALAEELFPHVQAIKQNRGIFDTFPLSLITTQTIDRLVEMVGDPLEVTRFRPNIVAEAAEPVPFLEDSWVGCVLRIGGIRMRVDKSDKRCVVITINPATAERNPAILRAVTRDRQGCLGVYGTTVDPGRIELDDLVFLEHRD